MNITKPQFYTALGVAAVAVAAIFLYEKYGKNVIAKKDTKDSGASKTPATSDGLVQSEMGRMASNFSTSNAEGKASPKQSCTASGGVWHHGKCNYASKSVRPVNTVGSWSTPSSATF